MATTTVFGRSAVERLMAIRLLPGHVVALAGMAVIVLGALLLVLPVSTMPGVQLGWLDAVFTATSAVCVTGLIVMDTPREFSVFGQVVILVLIQVGGLGYATMSTLLLLALGQRIGLRERMMMAEALSALDMQGLVRLVKLVVALTFGVEGVGALLLSLRFAEEMEVGQAVYLGIFHSVSAFNNAGFALFSDSLISYRADLGVNLIITSEIILGGIGFLIFRDILDNLRGRRFRLQTHTKLALLVSVSLLVVGTVGVWLLELNNGRTLGAMPAGEQAMVAYFHAVSARTTGFNTVDLSHMRDATLYLLILLMVIGGSPGSTAGGIKTTTFGIICLSVWSVIRQRADVELFHRRVPEDLVVRAVCLSILAMAALTGFTLLLAYTEGRSFLAIMFEVASALGTVGLSVGDGGVRSLSALFTDFGKAMVVLLMLLGRFGPLTIGLFAVKTYVQMPYRLPESKVVIG